MLHFIGRTVAVLCVWQAAGAERHFDFSTATLNEPPPGFRSAVTGEGKPGEWRVLEEEVAPPASAGAKSSVVTKRRILAQVSRDITDEHFPLCIFEDEAFTDFSLTTRFKTVGGAIEQMAGIAFRIHDEKNYYVVRASSLGSSLRFYKFVNGVRSPPIGPDVEIARGTWHELTVHCQGNQVRCSLNGKELISATDNSLADGKIGFWTKSDSVSHFTDTRIVYVPKVTLASKLLRETLKENPRLLGLKIYAPTPARKEIHIVASDDESEVGQPAGGVEPDVVARGVAYYGKEKGKVIVSLPLHDRNGDAVAAVRVIMKSFPGQTEQNAVARAAPIVKEMEKIVRSARDLIE